jgi:hypothetical protein
MQKIARIFRSTADSEKADREYYLPLTPEQRLDILLDLVAQAAQDNEAPKGFERVCRIVKLSES